MKLIKYRNICLLTSALLSSTLSCTGTASELAASSSAAETPKIFATVGNEVITQVEFDHEYSETARKKYYHFKPPAAEISSLQREVADSLVINALLLNEARRRGLKPDDAMIEEQLRQHEVRYANDAQWQQDKAIALPQITRQLQDQSLQATLKKLIRTHPQPTEEQLRDYYAAHLDKFTVPQQLRVSMIVLKVDPSSPSAMWQLAMEKGQELVQRLRAGADFAQMAHEISDHSSAEQGGDMGYLHGGMLEPVAEQAVDKLEPNGISDPITVIDGIAIIRLTERRPPRLNSFESAVDRVKDVWNAEQSETAWNAYIARLKQETPIKIDESYYLPSAANSSGGSAQAGSN